ncbi:F-box/kelch-repeat protein SKIP11 [Arabidopsis thaliana]|uniref:F-box/kelch-repeat protein SKIP11 n=4 Tax=Arabidopsis TaxID=3701 RepID=SKI11_ARATH|nr:Galactose oxidase/kelch repeat superfamily protein [Arabidopsis thaliana]NP_001030960.1 Galactose oxidase/kelch repeat superfamily protein [Arabidopsis thaliana]NP_178390.1 Galactose oxidase/kelch repeat superfamily protein [Arabidopsis thaliana]Q8L736.2 RecName: Full=F-box/kelch-repeat protein SKIP11; AltName: Full=SKP1-interacting partner 11 [Arabidopsis thaliana]KAG7635682.1 Kelch repeat type 1 [Arabidopsis thaliana x Arabidopsis arenosa]KAG7640329.1 Kelch repeat type 1 [Arabidopsis suec|eukprot:NP_001030959.1 Galactose oxidase/kelch repeat superfamily protein [Arabidopsis thaliana]
MLEDRSPDSCLSTRVFSSSRLSESNWSNSYMYPEDDDKLLGNGKRALEVVGEVRQTKSLKLMGFSIIYDSDSSDYSLSGGEEQADAAIGDGSSSRQEQEQQSDFNDNGGDSSDSHSLINEIGRDNSIDCLIRCSRSDYGSIASLNRNFRSLVKSGEIYRLRRQNGFVEHWVYFSCQLLEWVAFDPVERRWMQLPTMPSSVTFMCADKESLAVGTDLLVLGKDDFSSHVIYRYSLLTNSWSSGMKMNSPRCLFGSASLGEIAIFAGGCDSQGKILDFAEMYNSELQTWITLPRMNKPRKMCSGVFMDGKFYVIGGIGGADSKGLTCGEEYDLETKKWTQIPDLSPPRSRADQADMSPAAEAPPLVAVVNNQLYAADHADMEVRKYDKENKKWLTVGRLPERAGSVNGWGLAFRACGERLIVIGGPKCSGGGFIELNSWIPSDGGPPQWTLLDRKHSPTFVYNCAVMGC